MTKYVAIKKRSMPAHTVRCACGCLCMEGQSYSDHQFFCEVAQTMRSKRKQLVFS